MASYGALPDTGLVDTLEEGQRLTTVGYGATGFHLGGEPPRASLYGRPLQGHGQAPHYQQRRRRPVTQDLGHRHSRRRGGQLFRGFGRPLFMPDQETIVGVTSFGWHSPCAGDQPTTNEWTYHRS